MKWPQKHARAICIAFWSVLFSGWTILHFLSFSPTQFGIRCLVFELTGLLCPSCGATRMLEALIQWDFVAAFSFHPVFFAALLSLLGYAAYLTVRVFQTGRWPRPGTKFLLCVFAFVVLLAIFTVLRNLFPPVALY